MAGIASLGTSYAGAIAGKRLSRPVANLTDFYSKVTSYYGLLNGTDSGKLKSNIDTVNSNAWTRANFLESMQARQDPQLSVDWVAYVASAGSPTESIPWFFIDTLSTPSVSVETNPIFRNGVVNHYAGNMSLSGNLSLGMYTDISANSISLCSTWLAQVMDAKSRTYGVPSAYKRNLRLYLHDPRRRVVLEVTYFGCFPTSLSGLNLENASASPIVTTLELSCDWLSIGVAKPSA